MSEAAESDDPSISHRHPLLAELQSAEPLSGFSPHQLEQVASEIRDVLCNLLATRTAHFASNLGVVELCLALHCEFDFRRDRLIWDTGHQIYPHKLVTGRYHEFFDIRTRGGLMGYPNPQESVYDLFMTGHAGCSVSTAVGLRSGDILRDQADRKTVAVIGDGAFPSGIVFEAMNNAGELKNDMTIVLNDNRMSICPRVGAVATYLDRLRSNPFYSGLKHEVVKLLDHVPMFGDPAERLLAQMKEGVKAGLLGGMLFEELNIRYVGPIDGHDIALVRKYLAMAREMSGPVLLHVVTEKGHGYKPAAEDPVFFHTPPAFEDRGGQPVTKRSEGNPPYTVYARDAIGRHMAADDRVTIITAAMCQGNKLEPVREQFPDRFFDVGICESHAVAFAAGQCKTGLRPIVDIYSTFLQRSYDQIFQEVALQDLPVVFMMDRAGLTGPDGPTHHGLFDIGYMRVFPNLVLMAPGVRRRSGADVGCGAGSRSSHGNPLSESVGIRARSPARSDRDRQERSDSRRLRRYDRGLGCDARAGGRGFGHSLRGGAGCRSHQCSIRKADRRADGTADTYPQPVRGHRRRGCSDGRIRIGIHRVCNRRATRYARFTRLGTARRVHRTWRSQRITR